MIAIKDFGMPSCCDNCDIFNCADNACHITYTSCENPFDNRNDDCPLIEVSNTDEVMDDLRAEIEQIQGKEHLASDEFGNYYTYETIDKADVLEIIDKYQKRSEE